MENPSLEIINYQPEHQVWFEKLNRDWIEKYFWMEPLDVEILSHPDKHIIEKSGHIIMAKVNENVVGTVALKHTTTGVYELTKMAVDEKFRGQKIGEALAIAAIEKAKTLNAKKIILYSNTKLKPALALYRKLRFVEIPIDGPYKRSDIKMELFLNDSSKTRGIEIRRAIAGDAKLLRDLGEQTFFETFAEYNTAADMKLYLERNFTLEKINQELNDPQSTFLIAHQNNYPIGYVKVRTGRVPDELKNKAFEIERLYVIKTKIGTGAGKKLIEYAFEEGKQKGLSIVWLGVWEHNTRAIAFYERLEFKKFGAHDFMVGNDKQTDLLVKKDLSR